MAAELLLSPVVLIFQCSAPKHPPISLGLLESSPNQLDVFALDGRVAFAPSYITRFWSQFFWSAFLTPNTYNFYTGGTLRAYSPMNDYILGAHRLNDGQICRASITQNPQKMNHVHKSDRARLYKRDHSHQLPKL